MKLFFVGVTDVGEDPSRFTLNISQNLALMTFIDQRRNLILKHDQDRFYQICEFDNLLDLIVAIRGIFLA